MAASASGGIVGSAQTDITNPYETVPCGCIYCFVCLVQKLEGEEGEGWVCLRCGEIVKKCKPWNGDVLEEVCPSSSGKAVGFAVDDADESEDKASPEDKENSDEEQPLEEEEGEGEGEGEEEEEEEQEDPQHSKQSSTDRESDDENEAAEST